MTKYLSLSLSTIKFSSKPKRSVLKGGIGGPRTFKASYLPALTGRPSLNPYIGSDLAFIVSNRTAFEVPLRSVANSNIAGRTEVSLEFSTAPTAPTTKSKKGRPDELTEIRFYVPGTHTKEDDDEGGKDDDEEVSAAQAFHDLIKDKADIGQVTGDVLVSFSEVNIQTPRYVL
jgi:structure-specific recognition protein 1